MIINVKINGINKRLDVEVDEYLLPVLRRNGYVGVKYGCDTSSCGVCSILLDDEPVLSCSVLAIRADNKAVTTIEGIQAQALDVAEHLTNEGAEQCGYCSPGLAIMLQYLRRKKPNPTMDEVKKYLAGNLCRCSGYQAQHRALEKYLGVKK